MVASPGNRKLGVIFLVIAIGLLALTLYKMQTIVTFCSIQREVGQPSSVSQSWTPQHFSEAKETAPLLWKAPLLETKDEQVKVAYTLNQMINTDPLEYACKVTGYVKNAVESDYTYCKDEYFALKKPCLVYSFGINYDYTFDDAMGKLGCQVLSFDPSMNTTAHRRNTNVVFYPIGLGEGDTDTFVPKMDTYVKEKTYWKIRTLKTLLTEFNHLDRTIDLLKMDVEAYEWPVVKNMLDTGVLRNVKQLLLEWHIFSGFPARNTFLRLSEVMTDLGKAGFKAFLKKKKASNLNWQNLHLQSDMGYVNVNFVSNNKGRK